MAKSLIGEKFFVKISMAVCSIGDGGELKIL